MAYLLWPRDAVLKGSSPKSCDFGALACRTEVSRLRLQATKPSFHWSMISAERMQISLRLLQLVLIERHHEGHFVAVLGDHSDLHLLPPTNFDFECGIPLLPIAAICGCYFGSFSFDSEIGGLG